MRPWIRARCGRRSGPDSRWPLRKGRLARLLAIAPRAVSDADGVARIARRGGLRVHRIGEQTLELVVPA
ncbi:MAG: hypothetical protein QOG46_1131 [Pseudonocardiales bacterium]|nr:hypothetical protein [Pseudonocardiales bacterium]